MPQTSRIEWHGDAIAEHLREAAARGLGLAAEHLLQVSREGVPLEEGTLERSGVASVDADELTAAVSYDTAYAVRQHEDMTARHDQGRTAKYLEGPANEERDTMLDIIAAQVRRAVS